MVSVWNLILKQIFTRTREKFEVQFIVKLDLFLYFLFQIRCLWKARAFEYNEEIYMHDGVAPWIIQIHHNFVLQ